MGQINLIIALVFTLVIAIFSVLNVEMVRVNFLFTETELPLIIIIISSALIGGLIVGMVGLFRQYKLKKNIKSLKQTIEHAADKPLVGKVEETVLIPEESKLLIKEEEPTTIENRLQDNKE